MVMPEEYSLYDAKAHLSSLVRMVREGQSFIITVHGQPAAELRPISPENYPRTLADRVAELESRGEVTPQPRPSVGGWGNITPSPAPGALERFLEERE